MTNPEPNYKGQAIIAMDVLDHGFVALRNLAGPTRRIFQDFDADDTDPANSARMSFDSMDSGRTREADLKLCDYLIRNKHSTPIEMIECWVEMKMPIFVARQFVRHRTATINEVSGRYIKLPEEWYVPEVVGGKALNAKQGQEDTLEPMVQDWFKERLDNRCQRSYMEYTAALNAGVAPEHARLFLHLNHYTHWLWKQDLHNLLHFLSLRDHSHAQIEAQKYAQAIDKMLRKYLPNSMELYDKYRRNP
jgi:thymidylate synthase (FAD)